MSFRILSEIKALPPMQTMRNQKYALGGGPPPGWSVETALANGVERLHQTIEKSLFQPKLLIGPSTNLDAKDWPIWDQGARGTCNAFAIAAAEELTEAGHTGSFSNLSEEFIYAFMRQDPIQPLSQIGVNIASIDKVAIHESGGTFLYSALSALENHGICEEQYAVYDKTKRPVNYTVSSFSVDAQENAKHRRHSRVKFEHNITREPSTGDAQFWVNSRPDVPLSAQFANRLQFGLPVVASFAVLNGIGTQTWFGRLPQRQGLVRYPGDAVASRLSPIGGHTVCLIGVFANLSGKDNLGWFLFRNSHGIKRFAAVAREDGLSRFEPAPGYGVISARDVDRYCWEYLMRSDAIATE
jgi:hypothetical protein